MTVIIVTLILYSIPTIESAGALVSMLLFSPVFILLSSFLVRIKRVIVTDDGLIVSNYLREVRVPYDAVKEIRVGVMTKPLTVRLILKEPGAFGSSIRFIPRSR